MANKVNASLRVDRIAINSFHSLAAALNADIDQKRSEINPSIAYLTSDDNIDGGDVEAFKESMTSLSGILMQAKGKIDNTQAALGKMCCMLGDNAKVKIMSLKAAEDDMRKAVANVEQVGS